jgi:hypothetical protein
MLCGKSSEFSTQITDAADWKKVTGYGNNSEEKIRLGLTRAAAWKLLVTFPRYNF